MGLRFLDPCRPISATPSRHVGPCRLRSAAVHLPAQNALTNVGALPAWGWCTTQPTGLPPALTMSAFIVAPHALPVSTRRPRPAAPTCSTAPPAPSSASAPAASPPAPPHSPPTLSDPSSSSPLLETPRYKRLPVLGFLWDTFVRRVTGASLAARFGPVFHSDIFGVPCVVINDHAAVGECYRSPSFEAHGAYPPSFTQTFGPDILLFIDGQRHAAKRATVTPAFSPQLFPLYFDAIQVATEAFWARVAAELAEAPAARVRLVDLVKDHYFKSFLNVTTGGEYTIDGTSREAQYTAMRDQFIVITKGFTSPMFSRAFRRGLAAREALIRTITKLVCDRLASRADTIEQLRAARGDNVTRAAKDDLRGGRVDLLTVLCASSPLRAGPGTEHDPAQLLELAELVLMLWNAGSSTQSVTTLSCVFEAARDRTIWRRLRDEQAGLARQNRPVTLEQATKEQMPLLDSFINEILRIHPPVPAFFRRAAEDVVVLGHKIEKGAIVFLDVQTAHLDPDIYPDPNTLDIERFTDHATAQQPPPIYSFGAVRGAHFCIGAAVARMNMKATLGTLLREYDLELDPTQSTDFRNLPEVLPASGVVVSRLEKLIVR